MIAQLKAFFRRQTLSNMAVQLKTLLFSRQSLFNMAAQLKTVLFSRQSHFNTAAQLNYGCLVDKLFPIWLHN